MYMAGLMPPQALEATSGTLKLESEPELELWLELELSFLAHMFILLMTTTCSTC